MKHVLITAGNTHQPTFENVCHAVKATFGSVAIVHIFDTEGSEKVADENSRTSVIREIFGSEVDIRTSLVNEKNLQAIIPTRVSGLIDEFGVDSIIVDLTNGRKITASIMYAVAAIARVRHIFSLEMKVNPRLLPEGSRLPDLEIDKWEYSSVEALQEIHYIARSSQLELIYYRDRIDHACDSISEGNKKLARDFHRSLNNALLHYFAASASNHGTKNERIDDCIGTLGKICETVSKLTYDRYQQEDKTAKSMDDFGPRAGKINSVWEWGNKELSGQEQKRAYQVGIEFLTKVIQPSLTLGAILQGMVFYRNLVMHPGNKYQLTIDDARFVLSATLLILEQIGRTDIVNGGGE